MHRIVTALALAAAVAATAVGGAASAMAASSGPPAPPPAASYYLSLGDSLAQGVQPNAAGVSVETNQGYPEGYSFIITV